MGQSYIRHLAVDRKRVTSAEWSTGNGLPQQSNWQEKGYINWAIDRKRVTSAEQLTGKGLHQLSNWQEKGYINWAVDRKRVTPAEQLTGKGLHQLSSWQEKGYTSWCGLWCLQGFQNNRGIPLEACFTPDSQFVFCGKWLDSRAVHRASAQDTILRMTKQLFYERNGISNGQYKIIIKYIQPSGKQSKNKNITSVSKHHVNCLDQQSCWVYMFICQLVYAGVCTC